MQQEDESIFQEIANPRQKQIKVSEQQRSQVHSIMHKMHRVAELNSQIDVANNANKYHLSLKIKNIEFDNFMMKNNNKTTLKEVLGVVRQQLQTSFNGKISYVSDRETEQVMVVRFIEKDGNDGLFWIEDQTGRCKISVKRGIVWVGMICAIETSWENNMYKFQRVIDMSQPTAKKQSILKNNPLLAYRILLLKGPFRKNDQNQDIGCMILLQELQKLRNKDKVSIDCVVVMGPILSIKNKLVQNCQLDKTFQEEFSGIIQLIQTKIKSVYPMTQICFVPSLDDIINYYPIPQPQYFQAPFGERMHYLSNPSTLQLENGPNKISMTLLNYDLLKYIDTNKGGRPVIEVMQQNFETYLKQPFILTNASQAFDSTNIPKMYNASIFSDIIILSSQDSPPYVRDIKDKLIINIGSLGIDYHVTGKHFLSLVSIYDGEGPVSGRTKVQFIQN